MKLRSIDQVIKWSSEQMNKYAAGRETAIDVVKKPNRFSERLQQGNKEPR